MRWVQSEDREEQENLPIPFVLRAANDQVPAVYEQYLYGMGELVLADPDLVAFFQCTDFRQGAWKKLRRRRSLRK